MEMPKQSSFALLYKRLLDGNFEPDPGRAGQTLAALLRQLPVPPKKTEIPVEERNDLCYTDRERNTGEKR